MPDAAVEDVPVEGALERSAVVDLDHLDLEGVLLEYVLDELVLRSSGLKRP